MGEVSHTNRLKSEANWLHPQAKAAIMKVAMSSLNGEDIRLNSGGNFKTGQEAVDFAKGAIAIVRQHIEHTIDNAPADYPKDKPTKEFMLDADFVAKVNALPGQHPSAVEAIGDAAWRAESIAQEFLQDMRKIPLRKSPNP